MFSQNKKNKRKKEKNNNYNNNKKNYSKTQLDEKNFFHEVVYHLLFSISPLLVHFTSGGAYPTKQKMIVVKHFQTVQSMRD